MEGMFAEVFFALQVKIVPFLKFETRRKVAQFQDVLNFTFTTIKPADRQWGALQADGSWTGMVHRLQTQQVDIAATDFTVTRARSDVITFAQPITQIYHSLFIQNPSGTFNYMAYIEPLHYLSWVFVGVFCIVTPPAIFLTAQYCFCRCFTIKFFFIHLLNFLPLASTFSCRNIAVLNSLSRLSFILGCTKRHKNFASVLFKRLYSLQLYLLIMVIVWSNCSGAIL